MLLETCKYIVIETRRFFNFGYSVPVEIASLGRMRGRPRDEGAIFVFEIALDYAVWHAFSEIDAIRRDSSQTHVTRAVADCWEWSSMMQFA